ncbi:hypothetical protein BDP27DRAFT_1357382 [Rhodocollybia butyracea]|uniref:Uncharacterized protein n=1 Tax=Rhodocollybia butyracea TaxID=206335 RepID=A0A9P5UFH1_9AGAR|nr:hypothetical protein BDP27DRAFT_1357382 [Rhodocollybia butyracea]
MPSISVKNNTDSRLKVGFFILGMLHSTRWTNNLEPGKNSFEIRHEHGDGFDDVETTAQLAKMAAAGGSGTAAVVTGTAGVLGSAPLPLAVPVAGLLWRAANAVGARCAEEAPDSIKRVNLSVWFSPIELVICTGGAGIEVWHAGQKL